MHPNQLYGSSYFTNSGACCHLDKREWKTGSNYLTTGNMMHFNQLYGSSYFTNSGAHCLFDLLIRKRALIKNKETCSDKK